METWALLIVIILGYLACFGAGYFYRCYRQSRLDGASDPVQPTRDSIDRAENTAERISDVNNSIRDIFDKYKTGDSDPAKEG